jgi:hypothetical protein
LKEFTATTRCVVAAIAAVVLGLPAAVAADGGVSSDTGGGATYYDGQPSEGQISMTVASGAWVGRATRIRGRSADAAGQTIAIERRRSRRQGWEPVASVRVADDGTFATSWRPTAAGRHELRAVSADASSSDTSSGRAASPAERVTVYRKVTATWYGPGFYGNRTACGQRLTTSTRGVAHKTLPCGTKVAIRYRGRSVIAPVIDRGPYARGVTYDLTGATARDLGAMHTSRIGAAVLSR